MILKFSLFILLFLIIEINADDCTNCIKSKMFWCPEEGKCQGNEYCKSVIKTAINCPMLPSKDYLYDDAFTRKYFVPLWAAVNTKNPQDCFDNVLPTMKFTKSVKVRCYPEGPYTYCHAFTAYDTSKKAIIISVQGTDGLLQTAEEALSLVSEKVPFYDDGHLFKYFSDAFFDLWKGGLEAEFRNLKYLYPDYEIWIAGHSLGAAIASISASYIVKYGLASGENIKLMTIGQPRTGDEAWAAWHINTFPYSYRVVHHKDPIPHLPPILGEDPPFHHRYEVWYNNKMAVGDPYTICKEADGFYCSNTQIDLANDHVDYFDLDMVVYGQSNCTKKWNDI